ncbi:hypothetical protein B484DRAFT_443543 [Ochromonadaceae sp. CCMP2298]|nr:hypothetical protein B484DRAFT_443543 [Ochromonadaceae sp. CCMP2298]|mmetsp:Transcript_15655/g.34593  ORF Transcript_15655/g.34593 Transcript_15655/m.34593 type:complete len:200 (-) Transcript_15655:275-874(-)|eukprot:CAMPEP_0173194358 /NCGR_PEP_ID=MMETSP1141-20130122/14465_1 /TAXON_ID=483371 /ORGANISM="non described non described, Strain CCMP2298" /LENGTH=199 /DNA_ID=CAMNT_0014118787 /DNA_START=85 /DNA_END=684 /DNA_ORIENTATION=+
MYLAILALLALLALASQVTAFSGGLVRLSATPPTRGSMTMQVKNDDFSKANRAARKSGAGERMVELKKPMGMELDEDQNGNVFVKSIDPLSRAEKSGIIFVGDQIKMVSATFGDDMWSCEGVGLTRVMSCIKVRNTKPVKFVLKAATEAEEKKRMAIVFREPTKAEKEAQLLRDDELLSAMESDNKGLLKKRKGLFGLW